MRIRLKTRALLTYLCVLCCGTVLFGTYFLYTSHSHIVALKSHKGIDKAARDSWFNKDALLKFKPQVNKLELLQNLWKDGSDTDRVENDETEQQEQPQSIENTLPSKHQLLNMSWEELSDLYHRYTQQMQVTCSQVERLGRVTDGGWEVCEDPPYKPHGPCLVYSFGVGDDFSFDDAVARRYGCDVHSFDPSMKVGDHRRASSVEFHSLGLGNFTGTSPEGWKMATLKQIRSKLGHKSTPLSILKLDIEEWEWTVLPQLLKDGQLVDTRQLLMELHQCDGCSVYNPGQLDKEPPRERYLAALGIFRDLYDIGFRIFWQHQNKACRYISKFGLQERNACCEVHMVRVDS